MSTGSRVGVSAGPEEISAELEAMQAIGLAFSQLQDPMARARVLRWATECFEIPVETPPGPVSCKAALVAATPMDLTLEGVDEMFDPPAVAPPPSNIVHLEAIEPPYVSRDIAQLRNIHCEAADSEPLDSLMRALATDFQRFAVDWQRA